MQRLKAWCFGQGPGWVSECKCCQVPTLIDRAEEIPTAAELALPGDSRRLTRVNQTGGKGGSGAGAGAQAGAQARAQAGLWPALDCQPALARAVGVAEVRALLAALG